MDCTVKAFLIHSLASKSFLSIRSNFAAYACHGKLKLQASRRWYSTLQVITKVVLADLISVPLC